MNGAPRCGGASGARGRVAAPQASDQTKEGKGLDTSKIGFGEMVAGVSAVLLFVFMFLPWFGVSADAGGLQFSGNATAWESFSLIDILMFLTIVATIVMVVARAAGAMPPDLPAPPGLIVAGAGALVVLLILFRLLNPPDGPEVIGASIDVGRKIGIFLGLIAAAGITFGGYTAANERGSGHAPPG